MALRVYELNAVPRSTINSVDLFTFEMGVALNRSVDLLIMTGRYKE